MMRGLAAAKLFDVSNTRDWILYGPSRSVDIHELVLSLPTCIPPYPYSYLEMSRRDNQRGAIGVFVAYSRSQNSAIFSVFAQDYLDGSVALFLGDIRIKYNEDGSANKVLDDLGMVSVDAPMAPNMEVFDHEGGYDSKDNRFILAALGLGFANASFAFSLLHCRNVKAVEVDPRSQMTRQQIRDHERKKRPFVVYNVIEVKPFGSYRKGVKETEGEGRIKRLHQVRGHFAEYGDEYGKGKLFGRYSGRFYIPPHARGDFQNGVVASTYKIAKKTEEVRV